MYYFQKMKNIMRRSIVVLAVIVVGSVLYGSEAANAHPKGLLFPIAGGASFSNDFTGSRTNGQHNATDIFAPKKTKIVAAVDGVVRYIPIQQPSSGYIISIRDNDGFTYDYIHINNDTPGTDDGNGGAYHAYAPDVIRGERVIKGQFLAYVGDSGNAENTPPHLHLEITAPGGEKINPYPYLLEAQRVGSPVPHPERANEILPYGPTINAPVSLALGVFDNDTTQIVSGTGVGYSPHVQTMHTDGSSKKGFYAYAPSFTGGVDVATGDVDGDGVDEIITGTKTGAPHVQVFDMAGKVKGSFYAFSPLFTGGVNVGAVDTNNDGIDEILVGAGSGGSPHVRVLRLDGSEVLSFYAYAASFSGGVDVSAGDVSGGAADEIVTVPGPGGSAHLRIFSGNGEVLSNGFNAYEAYTGYTGGARVSVGNVVEGSAKDEILVGPNLNGGPHFRLLAADGNVVREGYYLESWWTGSYDVAAGDSLSLIGTGDNRRSTIRKGPQ